MGLSFLSPKEATYVAVTVRWGDYSKAEIAGADDRPISVWQRQPREETVAFPEPVGSSYTSSSDRYQRMTSGISFRKVRAQSRSS